MHRHTLLMNKVLAMCSASMHKWPSTLYDHGYRILAIERSVRVGSRTVVPDIMLLNEREGHVLIIDCKGGANIKPDQDGRYSQIRLEDILESAKPPCAIRSHTFMYAIDEAHEVRMRAHTRFAMIAFGHHTVRGFGDIGHGSLTRELRDGVSLGGTVPQFILYPFSINDEDVDVDAYVQKSMHALLLCGQKDLVANRATAAKILRNAHPFHAHYAPAHAAELVEVTRLSIERLLARRSVEDRPRARQGGFK